MNRFVKLLLLLLIGFLPAETAQSQAVEPVSMKLIVGETDATPTVGLILTPQPGWRIYAPAPTGKDNQGFPPKIKTTGSVNLKALHPVWPLPEKTNVGGQTAYVYTTETLVPLQITPEDPTKPSRVALDISVLSCAQLCVPVQKTLKLRLTPGGPEDPRVSIALEEIEAQYEGTSLLMILLIALLGGFILNFMPCVLPVLSLKLMYFGKHKDQVASSFAMTALGILASFLLLALGAIALKASGEMVGWGMHFQNPYFLTFIFIVILIFAASMLGVFEFRLSGAVADKATHAGEKSRLKDFFSGVFATLLATPCSAPFVGTSLSFALARDYSDILAVFMALGLGFASPYIVGLLIPSHKLPMPKPGKWMVGLQRILGLGLLATAVWLGYVLLAHVTLTSLLLITAGAAVMLLQLWVQHRITWLTLTLGTGILLSLNFLQQAEEDFKALPDIATEGPCMSLWCTFDPQAIPHLVAQGYTVIVDVTADWCVTCAVNKKAVFDSPRVTKALTHENVIAMRADWTKKNEKITEFLQSNTRFGIPFNIVFGPGAPNGIPLPEILTVEKVLTALKQAQKMDLKHSSGQ